MLKHIKTACGAAALALMTTTAAPAMADTITFLGGNGDLTDPANWSGLPISGTNTNPIGFSNGGQHSLIFDTIPETTSTWGTTNGSYYIADVTFSNANGFDMASPPSGSIFKTTALVETTVAADFAMPAYNDWEDPQYNLHAGSSLTIKSSLANGANVSVTRTGAGAPAVLNLNYRHSRELSLDIGDDAVVNNSNSNGGYVTTIESLSGTGDLQNVVGPNGGGRLLIEDQDLTDFTGVVRNQSSAFVILGAGGTGESAYTMAGGHFIADGGVVRSFTDGTFEGSRFSSGSGSTQRFAFSDNVNSPIYGNGRSLTAAGSEFAPGETGAAGIMEIFADVVFAEHESQKSTLFIDIVGAGTTAGTDHDQLQVVQSSGAGTGGGNVTSASDASNRLADVQLVIDLASALASEDLSSNTYTILTSDASSFADSSFADVSFAGGWDGDVNYNSNGTVTLSNLTFIPEPASLTLLALGGLAMLRRRRALA